MESAAPHDGPVLAALLSDSRPPSALSSLPFTLHAAVALVDTLDKGRTLIATRDCAPGEVLICEDATLFAPSEVLAAARAGGLPALLLYSRAWAAPRRWGNDLEAAHTAVAQLHPERAPAGGWTHAQPEPTAPAAGAREAWLALHSLPHESLPGAASRAAIATLDALWRDHNACGAATPSSPRWRYRLSERLAAAADEELLRGLLVRVVSPLNAIGCECRLPAADAQALIVSLRARVGDAGDGLAAAGVPPLPLPEEAGQDECAGSVLLPLTGLFLLTAMLSHSCAPSAFFRSYWCSEQQAPQVRVAAARALRAGEEITISYLGDGPEDAQQRAASLQGYGFSCRCERCVDARAGADDALVWACPVCAVGAVPGHALCDGGGGGGADGGGGDEAASGGGGGACGGSGASGGAGAGVIITCALRCRDCGARVAHGELRSARGQRLSCAAAWRLRAAMVRDGDARVAEEPPGGDAGDQPLLHETDAVRISAAPRELAAALARGKYAAAAAISAALARAARASRWASHRRLFFALLEAGEAAALAGAAGEAARLFTEALESIRAYEVTDGRTPLMRALQAHLRAALQGPPLTGEAARRWRRERLRMEEDSGLIDDNY